MASSREEIELTNPTPLTEGADKVETISAKYEKGRLRTNIAAALGFRSKLLSQDQLMNEIGKLAPPPTAGDDRTLVENEDEDPNARRAKMVSLIQKSILESASKFRDIFCVVVATGSFFYALTVFGFTAFVLNSQELSDQAVYIPIIAMISLLVINLAISAAVNKLNKRNEPILLLTTEVGSLSFLVFVIVDWAALEQNQILTLILPALAGTIVGFVTTLHTIYTNKDNLMYRGYGQGIDKLEDPSLARFRLSSYNLIKTDKIMLAVFTLIGGGCGTLIGYFGNDLLELLATWIPNSPSELLNRLVGYTFCGTFTLVAGAIIAPLCSLAWSKAEEYPHEYSTVL